MSKTLLCAGFLFCWLGREAPCPADDAAPAKGKTPAAAPQPAAPGPEATARRLWAITELVLDNHIDPPSRQEMLLAAVKALLKARGAAPPIGLSRRVSTLMAEKEFAALLGELWPKGPGGKPLAPADAALLDGMLRAIPGPTRVLEAQEMRISTTISSNRYVGIGIQIAFDPAKQYTKIVNPVRRGPARLAGAKPGDLIVEIEGQDVHKVGVAQVVKILRGEAGTPVTIVVRQPGSRERRTLKMVRREIPFDTVLGFRRASENEWKFRPDPAAPIAYLWLKGTTSSTLHELRKVERRLKADGTRALVVDLRFSAGDGVIGDAALVAGAFLSGKELWRIRDGRGRVRSFRTERDCLFRDWPVVVLIDEGIRDMATQMLIASLRDNGRAVLVGQPTRGDGCGNSVLPVPGRQEMLLLRTFRVERVGAKPGEWGVRPDHLVALTARQRRALQKWLADKDLPELPAGTDDAPPDDPQLAKALEVLRAALKKPGK
jgi:carboxyl-terminal processing protease